jgi:hypothetical protein
MEHGIAGTMAQRPRPGMPYWVGVDLGQKQDHSAIAVVEREVITGTRRNPATWELDRRTVYTVRYLERMPLGTSYLDVAAHVARLTRDIRMTNPCELVVDATGVGAPVVDVLRRAKTGCSLYPVTITAGEHEQCTAEGYRVPKRDLVVGLELLLEAGALEISRGLETGEELLAELRAMRVSVSAKGHERFEASRNGEHDDLVLATALACWRAKRGRGWDVERS